MQRKAAFVAVLSLLATLILVASASADQPVATPFTATTTGVVNDLCSFPVTFQDNITGTLTIFTDGNGTRASLHDTFQDVYSANGKSLTGLPTNGTLFAPVESDGSFGPVTGVGIQERVPLPDGSLFKTAGRVTGPATGTFIIPDNGSTINLAGFCAALAP